MKTTKLFLVFTLLCIGLSLFAQQNEIIPDLTKINDSNLWVSHNREINIDKEVHLDGKSGDGSVSFPKFSNDHKYKNER